MTLFALAASVGLANPVDGIYFDAPTCDNHGTRQAVEELGTVIFPTDELISSSYTQTTLSACAPHDDPGMVNYLVSITNLSGRDWTDLFYVGDLETFISNVDGEAFSAAAPGAVGLAFRIDAVGMNRNLVFESMSFDGVFQAGETWQFILQDFLDPAGGPPDDFSSLDFAGASAGLPGSTGSIVQMLIPSPGVLAMMGLGGLMSCRRRR